MVLSNDLEQRLYNASEINFFVAFSVTEAVTSKTIDIERFISFEAIVLKNVGGKGKGEPPDKQDQGNGQPPDKEDQGNWQPLDQEDLDESLNTYRCTNESVHSIDVMGKPL